MMITGIMIVIMNTTGIDMMITMIDMIQIETITGQKSISGNTTEVHDMIMTGIMTMIMIDLMGVTDDMMTRDFIMHTDIMMHMIRIGIDIDIMISMIDSMKEGLPFQNQICILTGMITNFSTARYMTSIT